jgi:HEAT repeat protein
MSSPTPTPTPTPTNTTATITPPQRCRHPLPRLVWIGTVVALLVPGCAGWKPFQPWERAAREREKYGPNADARIKDLLARSKAAKAGSAEKQLEFTQELSGLMLAEHDPRVRVKILQTAAEYDTASATAICTGALQDPDDQVRSAACDVWAKRGGDDAVALLASRFQNDQDHDVRLRALRMLGELKDKDAIPVLARALEDADPAVQYRAVASLKQVSGRDLGNDVNAWRAWAADPSTAPEWSIAEQFRRLF